MPHKRSPAKLFARHSRKLDRKGKAPSKGPVVLPGNTVGFLGQLLSERPYLRTAVTQAVFVVFPQGFVTYASPLARARILAALLHPHFPIVSAPSPGAIQQFREDRRIALRHIKALRQKREFLRRFGSVPLLKQVKLHGYFVSVKLNRLVTYMPKRGKKSSGNSGGGGGGGKVVTAGLRGVTVSDLLLAPVNPTRVPRSVPRSFARQTVWTKGTIQNNIVTSNSGITETNFTFTLVSLAQQSQWSALYDMFFLAQAAVSLYSEEAPGEVVTPPRLHTAIDFNSNANLGSIAGIENFESHVMDTLPPGKVVTRMCKPCINMTVPGSNTSSSRSWVPTSSGSTPHFGIRTLFETQPVGTGSTITVLVTMWFAFRNGI